MKKLSKLVIGKENQLEAYACSDCGACDCYGGTTQDWVGIYAQITNLGTLNIAISG